MKTYIGIDLGGVYQVRHTWLPAEFKDAVPDFLTAFGIGDFSTRKGLNAKDRELLTVVILAALGGAEVQCRRRAQSRQYKGRGGLRARARYALYGHASSF